MKQSAVNVSKVRHIDYLLELPTINWYTSYDWYSMFN